MPSQRIFQSLAGPGPGQNKPILIPIPADEKFGAWSDTAQNSTESQENLDYLLKKSGKMKSNLGVDHPINRTILY